MCYLIVFYVFTIILQCKNKEKPLNECVGPHFGQVVYIRAEGLSGGLISRLLLLRDLDTHSSPIKKPSNLYCIVQLFNSNQFSLLLFQIKQFCAAPSE